MLFDATRNDYPARQLICCLVLEQGVSAPLVGAACENACLFLTYNKFQDIILNIRPTVGGIVEVADGTPRRRELTLGELALAAGAAGAAASFLLYVPTFDIAFRYAGRALKQCSS